jgi:hypothetical protein
VRTMGGVRQEKGGKERRGRERTATLPYALPCDPCDCDDAEPCPCEDARARASDDRVLMIPALEKSCADAAGQRVRLRKPRFDTVPVGGDGDTQAARGERFDRHSGTRGGVSTRNRRMVRDIREAGEEAKTERSKVGKGKGKPKV